MSMENIFKSFDQLPGGEEEPKEEAPEPVAKTEDLSKLKGEDMLARSNIDMESPEKLDFETFFQEIIKYCGYIPGFGQQPSKARRVILMSAFKGAFLKYYDWDASGKKGDVIFSRAFDEMYRYKQIDFIPHSRGKDSYLTLPRSE